MDWSIGRLIIPLLVPPPRRRSQGFYANATGLCAPCLENCTLCSNATSCDSCTMGTAWDAARGACVPCEQEVRALAGAVWGQGGARAAATAAQQRWP